jgi:hypothetical protein
VNQSIAQTMEVPLIGCASHKFNLAVQRWIKGQPELQEIIAKVRSCTCCIHFDISCIHFAISCIHFAIS